MENHRDVVIIGAGAAGLTAGIVLARAQANVLVIDDGKPRNAAAAHMHGFVSRDVAPSEFLATGRHEVARYGGEFTRARVADATRTPGGSFTFTLADGTVVHAFGVRIVDGTVARLVHDKGSLTGAELSDGSVIACETAFIAPRPSPNDGVLRTLGCETDATTGLVSTTTGVAGVWATAALERAEEAAR